MLGFAPIGSGPIAGNNSSITTEITVAAAWAEGSESEVIAGTVTAAAIAAVIAWTEGSESEAITGTVAGLPSVAIAVHWTEGSEVNVLELSTPTIYTSAPAGAGYAPRAEQQCRPPDTQRNYR